MRFPEKIFAAPLNKVVTEREKYKFLSCWIIWTTDWFVIGSSRSDMKMCSFTSLGNFQTINVRILTTVWGYDERCDAWVPAELELCHDTLTVLGAQAESEGVDSSINKNLKYNHVGQDQVQQQHTERLEILNIS